MSEIKPYGLRAFRCNGKVIYPSEKAASKELRRMRRTVIDPFRLATYRCEAHNGWHIGNVRLSWKRR